MDSSRLIAAELLSLAKDVLAGWYGEPVSDPDIIAALKKEGFELRRGYYQKVVNLSPDGHPDLAELWRGEQRDGKLILTSRYNTAPKRGFNLVRFDLYPDSLKKLAHPSMR